MMCEETSFLECPFQREIVCSLLIGSRSLMKSWQGQGPDVWLTNLAVTLWRAPPHCHTRRCPPVRPASDPGHVLRALWCFGELEEPALFHTVPLQYCQSGGVIHRPESLQKVLDHSPGHLIAVQQCAGGGGAESEGAVKDAQPQRVCQALPAPPLALKGLA